MLFETNLLRFSTLIPTGMILKIKNIYICFFISFSENKEQPEHYSF